MVEGGPIDVLTGDWLAELTMLILWKGYQRDSSRGWADTFLTQMEEVLGTCIDRGIKVVTNAGGLNPAGLADQVRALADRLGHRRSSVAHVEGDDLLRGSTSWAGPGTPSSTSTPGIPWPRPPAIGVGQRLPRRLAHRRGPVGRGRVVVCPRVTDASLVVGPAAWHHGWAPTDWDRLAGAVAAGHIIECGPQATGGNYAFFAEVAGLEHPGSPSPRWPRTARPSSPSTRGPAGEVSVGTVTAQLLYEIAGPRYPNTDVVARFDTIALEQEGPDRVRVRAPGLPAPPTAEGLASTCWVDGATP